MQFIRPLLIGTVALLSVSLVSGAGVPRPRTGPKSVARQSRHHVFHGEVVSVHHDKDGKFGHFLVKEHKTVTDKAGDKVKELIEKKFHVHPSTTFEVVREVNGKKETQILAFSALHKGEHVIVHYKNHDDGKPHHAHEHIATEVKIQHHHKK
jgi:hypothetical protein